MAIGRAETDPLYEGSNCSKPPCAATRLCASVKAVKGARALEGEGDRRGRGRGRGRGRLAICLAIRGRVLGGLILSRH